MNSVKHYLKEIEDLEAALRVTRETLKEVAGSLAEFVPFKEGDVIAVENKVRTINNIIRVELSNKNLVITANVHYPNPDGSYGGDRCPLKTEYIPFDLLERIKIIYSKPDEQ